MRHRRDIAAVRASSPSAAGAAIDVAPPIRGQTRSSSSMSRALASLFIVSIVLDLRKIAFAASGLIGKCREAYSTVLEPDPDRALAGQQAIDGHDRQALFAPCAGVGRRRCILDGLVEIFASRHDELGGVAGANDFGLGNLFGQVGAYPFGAFTGYPDPGFHLLLHR